MKLRLILWWTKTEQEYNTFLNFFNVQEEYVLDKTYKFCILVLLKFSSKFKNNSLIRNARDNCLSI